MKVAVFHPGTQHSWQTALALQQLGLLEWYATSIFYQRDRFPYCLERLAPKPLARRMHDEFRRFSHPLLDPRLIRTSGMAEWFERIAARAGWERLARGLDRLGNRQFVHQIAGALRSPEPFTLWGYSGSALSSFELAHAQDRCCILDRTIGDYRVFNARMDAIADQYGAWFLPTERSIPAGVIALDDHEYALADTILVGCEAAAQTIRDSVADQRIASKVRVLNYCYDEALFANASPPRPVERNGPVRFLFVGLANPRKGIQHVLEAIARIPRSAAELTIVGDLRIPGKIFAEYADRVNYRRTVARSEIPAIMAQHHVLIFPSYFEGSALSLLEGLASGLALIQTDEAGNGVTPETGILLDRNDSDTVYAAMMAAIEDRDRLDGWRAQAQAEAARYSFAIYRENIASLLDDLAIRNQME